MPRATSAKVTKKHLTKEEKATRLAVENAFTDNAEVVAPSYLNEAQLEVFNFITEVLRKANVLSTLDTVTITQASVVIDMLNNSNKTVADNPSLALDGMFTQNMERLTRTYLKLCDALCLSPQSRAKMGALIANKKKEETDPLMNVLKGEANE